MLAKELSKYYKKVNLRDWSKVDFTGATNNAVEVQAWQDEAAANGYIAEVPGGIVGLSQKVTFKAPTIGAGGAVYGRQNTQEANRPYTSFTNLGINDNSWMIDVATDASYAYSFGLLRGFRVHAGGLNVSLMRVLGIGSDPTGFALQEFEWDDIVAYGGYVNLENYGFGGTLRRIYSRAAKLSAFRQYLGNALVVEGGWYGVANKDAWEFEVFIRQGGVDGSGTEGIGGIVFNQPVFQSRDASSVGNGLRISERVTSVTLNGYFESHVGGGSGGGVSLQVGWNRGDHPSPAIPTAVDIAGADAPTNSPIYAVRGIDLSGVKGAVGAGYTLGSVGPRYMFNNVTGIRWGVSSTVSGRHIEYTKYTKDINGHPTQGANAIATPSMSGVDGVTTTGSVAAGVAVIPATGVDATRFTVGNTVYLQLDAVTGKAPIHESTVKTITNGVSIELNDAVPTGRAAAAGNLLSRNKVNRTYAGAHPQDELNRGGDLAINLLPAGNFPGTIASATVGGFIHGVKQAAINSWSDGAATIATDYTVKRGGRPTLKITRLGTTVADTSTRRFWFYPWGNEKFIQAGVPIIVAGWMLLEDAAPYNNVDVSGNGTTFDTPSIGLSWANATREVHAASNFGVSGNGPYPIPGQWCPFWSEYILNDPGVTRIGINILPVGSNYPVTTDFSCWFDSLGIFVNPKSHAAIREGVYIHNPAAGHFDADDKFEVRCSTPTSSPGVYAAQGDRFVSNVGTVGAPKAWQVSAAGPASTATFTSEGNL